MMNPLKEGDQAPAFAELTANKGKTVVVFFYPKDNTSGCTIEACELRDSHKKILSKDAIVLGVSPDSAKSHDKFIEKFSLPYVLVPDESHAIVESYGVWKQKIDVRP